MKNKVKLLAIIALAAVIGFSFAALSLTGCDTGNGNTHTHSYSTTWSKNETQHWHECSCGDKTDVADHTGDPCTVCDYESPHTHSYSTTWSKNETQHWHECSCGDKTDIANHTGDTWSSNETQHWKECICGYKSELADHSENPCAVCDYFSGTPVSGANLADKLSWLSSNAESDTAYLVEVNADTTMSPQTLSYNDKTGIIIALKGTGTGAGAERAVVGTGAESVISLTENGTFFKINAGVTLVLMENITLSGGGTNNAALIEVSNDGKLIMKDGAKLTNNQNRGVYLNGEHSSFVMDGGEITDNSCGASYGGGGVFVSYGTFVMNGGIIARNKYSNTVGGGGGVSVQSGAFTMNGGKISDNTVENNIGAGGGVSNDLGTFTMTGGEISGNRIIAWDNPAGDGGGVSSNGTFTMSGGVIKGNSARYGGGVQIHSGVFEKTASGGIIYGNNGGENANTATNNETSGSAIYVYSYGGYVHRETTVTANERLYVSHNPQTNEGAWEVYE